MWHIINYIQQSMLLPARIRVFLLRLAGLKIHPTSRVSSGVFIGGKSLSIGKYSFVNINCFMDGCAPIKIGDNVRIGSYAKLLTGTHTINSGVLRRGGSSQNLYLPIEIKQGCWIGLGAIILPGVTVAQGCVVGAGAVVTKSTESNGLYIGNPARRIKDLPIKSD